MRRELFFEVQNELRDDATLREDLEPYGGRRLLERMAALFAWRDLRFEHLASEKAFRVSWRVPVSERTPSDDGA